MATSKNPVLVAFGVDEYSLVCGRSHESATYGDVCSITHGGKTYIALIYETSDGERLSLLPGQQTVVEVRSAPHNIGGVYDEHQGETALTAIGRSKQSGKSAGAEKAAKQGGKDAMATKITVEDEPGKPDKGSPADDEDDDSGIERIDSDDDGEDPDDSDDPEDEDDDSDSDEDDDEDWEDDEDEDDDWDEDEDEDEDSDSDDQDPDEDEDES